MHEAQKSLSEKQAFCWSDQLELVKSELSFLPSCETFNCMDSYWDYWILCVKLR